MPQVEITVPEHLEMQIAQMVEQGEFLNREQAIEELLSMGASAYDTGPEVDESPDELFTQTVEDQQDPAMDTDPDAGPGDGHTL